MLTRAGARVLTADDGAEALRMMEGNAVDLILTDKQMPNVNGMDLLRQLRERGVMTPAILFVNGVVPEDAPEMERLGVAQTVTKPIHPLELVRIMEAVLADR